MEETIFRTHVKVNNLNMLAGHIGSKYYCNMLPLTPKYANQRETGQSQFSASHGRDV